MRRRDRGGPVTKQGARGAIRSVYCRDPDGSLIDLRMRLFRTYLKIGS